MCWYIGCSEDICFGWEIDFMNQLMNRDHAYLQLALWFGLRAGWWNVGFFGCSWRHDVSSLCNFQSLIDHFTEEYIHQKLHDVLIHDSIAIQAKLVKNWRHEFRWRNHKAACRALLELMLAGLYYLWMMHGIWRVLQHTSGSLNNEGDHDNVYLVVKAA